MMYQLPTQDITYQEHPVQYSYTPSTGIEEIDIRIMWDSVLSNWIKKRLNIPFYHNLICFINTDLSSILSDLETKSETLRIEEPMIHRSQKTISEEEIAIEMLRHDFIVKMPPKKRYKIQVHVKSLRKGEPRLIESNEFLVTE